MKVTATSTDGVVEAIEFVDNDTFFLAVQWHPEMMFDAPEQLKLFQTFINSCKKNN